MLQVSLARLKQGHRTIPYPAQEPTLPDRFRGLPVVDASKCRVGCRDCAEACPTNAITIQPSSLAPHPSPLAPHPSPLAPHPSPLAPHPSSLAPHPSSLAPHPSSLAPHPSSLAPHPSSLAPHPSSLALDLGRCLFCTDCVEACPEGAIRYTQDYRLATRTRDDLVLRGQVLERAKALEEKSRRLFGRSLKLRQVSAAGCNACEADLNVLNTVVFDLGRFGIQFVASPRHADGLVVTGPVSENMRLALLETYAAVPAPKLVIAVGACAISGGPYIDNPEVHNGCGALLPVDLYIPGCPPHPLTTLDGLLRLLGRLE